MGLECWNSVEIEVLLKNIIPKLQNYETMTWGKIIGKESHFIKPSKCSKEAQKRLSDTTLENTEQLFSLRIGSEARIFGIKESGMLYLLWWDPKHQVYPVEKGNA